MTKTKTRLRVFEDSDGVRFVKQMSQDEVDRYLANNPDVKLIR